MRIQRPERAYERALELEVALKRAMHATHREGRICGVHCDRACPTCGSRDCQCQCSPYCTDASRLLSSEPDVFPIEARITPLVYQMKRLGLFEACWSCEGHLNPDGSLQKPPAVWFYCDTMAHVRLLASGLAKLKFAGRLSAHWRITVTFSDADNPDATFALEPALGPDGSYTLDQLQRDADEIARNLQIIMSEEARALMREAGLAA